MELKENQLFSAFTDEFQLTVRNPEDITKLEQFKYDMMLYEAAIELMKAKLQVLQEEFLCLTERTPIDHITTRIKSPRSIIEKMQRKDYPMTLQSMKENVRDIAGIRIICPFLSDVYEVAKILSKQSEIHVQTVKDYIAEPKSNGYRSLHMLVTVDVNLSSGIRRVPVEFQIRTIAMNCWAGVEHQIRYKKSVDSEGMDKVLLNCARLMEEADTSLQNLIDTIPGMRDDYGVLAGEDSSELPL